MKKCMISNNIRKLRFFNDEMTQKQLADTAGVSRQTIISIESDKYSPSLELAFRLAHVFGLPLEEVFSCKMVDVAAKPKKKGKKTGSVKLSATK